MYDSCHAHSKSSNPLTSLAIRITTCTKTHFKTGPNALSVPKILTLFIPEILSRPAIAGRARTLPVPPVGRPVGRREEDVGNVKASRSRDSIEGRSLQDRSGPFGGSVPVLR